MIAITIKQLWARKRRALGSGIAIVIGVAFLTATMILGGAMTRGIEALFVEGYSGTDVQVLSQYEIDSESVETVPIPATLLDELAAVPGVERALPVVEGTAQIVAADGKGLGGNGPPTIGQNWVESPRNPYVVVDGRPPAGPGEIAIDSGSAESGDLAVGDVTTVRVPHPVEVTVVGVVELESGSSLGGVTFAYFDTETAQRLLLGGTDLLSAVDLQAEPGVDVDALRDRVGRVIPDGTKAATGAELTELAMEEMESDFLGFFKVFLTAFAVIALLVASFSIGNTFSIVVAQRTRESALLRALGASSRQILATVAGEAVLIGAMASAIGLGVGVLLARGLDALLDAGGAGVPNAGMDLTTGTAVTGLVTGLGVTLVAVLVPAWRASRVAPLAALREVAVDHAGTSVWRGIAGVVVTAGGVAAVILGPSTGEAMMITGLGALASFVGFVLLGPLAARLAARVIGAPIAVLRGTNGKLARGNAARNPRRTAGTASALMIGAAVVALFANVASSIKHSMTELVDQSFGGDLVVRPDGFSGAGLDPALRSQLAELPEVALTAAIRDTPVELGGEATWLLASDVATMAEIIDLGDVTGDLSGMGPDEIAVGTDWAEEAGVGVGDALDVRFADGTEDALTVVATYTESDLMGDHLVDVSVLEPHHTVASDFLVFVSLADGVSLDAGRAAVATVTEPAGDPLVETSDEYLDAMASELDAALGLVYGLLGLAVVIALIGIANALSLSLHERTRELGLLRAVGQTRRALRATVRWESVIIAVFGTLGGVALGTFLCWGLVRAIATTEGFAQFAPSFSTLAVVMVVAVGAGVLAAWRPARRASRLDVLDAIASE